jgi:hypothetical protein
MNTSKAASRHVTGNFTSSIEINHFTKKTYKMKATATITLIVTLLLLLACQKPIPPNNDVTHINCDGLITDTLGTNDNGRIYMPNAFTPNSDGLNDISRPYTQNVSAIAFTIYDENNNVVFTTTVLGQGWSTSSSPNTWVKYYYKIQVTTVSGHKIGICGLLYKLSCFPGSLPKNSLYFEDQLTSGGFTGTTNETLSNCP